MGITVGLRRARQAGDTDGVVLYLEKGQPIDLSVEKAQRLARELIRTCARTQGAWDLTDYNKIRDTSEIQARLDEVVRRITQR